MLGGDIYRRNILALQYNLEKWLIYLYNIKYTYIEIDYTIIMANAETGPA